MLVFGTQMHIVTFVFVVLEIAMFFYQLIYYLSRPQKKNRYWYLILLFLLIVYNITGGLFPDDNIKIPIIAQNIIAYGSGFIMASYFPIYFYKAFDLKRLRFHALYGIYLFLIVPFLLFFVIGYSRNGNLEDAIKHGIIVPFFYALIFVWNILSAINAKYGGIHNKIYWNEVVVICFAVLPWASMPILVYFEVSQVVEVTICNSGLVIVTLIFINKSIKKSKQEYNNLLELNTTLSEKVKERTLQLEKLNEQKTNNFINLVHETKTPLTLVNNYLEEYISKYGSVEEMDIIKGGINKLTTDVINLFDIERFTKGIGVYHHTQISNFSEILKNSLTLFEYYCQKQFIVCSKSIEENIFIKADPNAINRIVNNLIENAIKFSDTGAKINISLKTEKDKIIFSVKDTGIGILPELQKKIFEPYYQINHKTTSLQGMGLGLPIVKKVVDSLGGQIHIESNSAKVQGTVISVTLKKYNLRENDMPVIASADAQSLIYNFEHFDITDTPYLPNRQSLLLVEDNKAMLHFLFNKLSAKYNVFCSLNGVEALRKLHDLTFIPDLILADIMMDRMDGYAFAKIVSEQEAYKHIPIIFLSAKSTPMDKLKGLRLGAIDFIPKPFSFEELNLKIETVLDNIKNQKKAILNASISNLKVLETVPSNAELGSKLNQNFMLYNLTNREIEIAQFILKGSTYKAVAKALFISEKTVNKHIQNIFEKVGVANKVELINKLHV